VPLDLGGFRQQQADAPFRARRHERRERRRLVVVVLPVENARVEEDRFRNRHRWSLEHQKITDGKLTTSYAIMKVTGYRSSSVFAGPTVSRSRSGTASARSFMPDVQQDRWLEGVTLSDFGPASS
jgi:hypothetical protein